MTNTVLDALPLWQMALLAVCFFWSGFVRSGLGFGGAALTLPLLLMFVNDPLLWLPAVGIQLLFFTIITVATRLQNIDWGFLSRLIAFLAVPFIVGLFGLLNLPVLLLSAMLYCVTLLYGYLYFANIRFTGEHKLVDNLLLTLGGYIGGVSLMGAPLIVAVASKRLPAARLRDTMFILWILMVLCKLGTFVVADVSLQWRVALVTLPFAALGHMLGLRAHQLIVSGERDRFERVVGGGLIAVSAIGLVNLLL